MNGFWQSTQTERVLNRLKTSARGLTSAEAKRRLKEYGHNRLRETPQPSLFFIFARQFKSVFVVILGAAFGATLFLKEYSDAAVIAIALLLNACVGFLQEARAQRALTALKKLIQREARVLRDGHEMILPSSEVVPGDIIILEAGNRIPADARILEVYDLEVDEAPLTGESFPIVKTPDVISESAALADRKNMVFFGTTIVSGRGRAVVVGTGVHTEMGEISREVAEIRREPTPLETQIKQLASLLSILILAASTLFFAVGIIAGKEINEIFLTATALAVAAVPEGLLVSMTVVLAIGMERLVRERAIVRSLLAAETLGSVSVVCVDKTGTVTEGEMRVEGVWTGKALVGREYFSQVEEKSNQGLFRILQIGMLCNNAVVENPEDPVSQWRILADPTQKALFLAGIEGGLRPEDEAKRLPRFDEIPFSSLKKYAITAHRGDEKHDVLFFCGASERILEASVRIATNGRTVPLGSGEKKKILQIMEDFASKGFRVVGVGFREVPRQPQVLNRKEDFFGRMAFAGFFLLRDPLREGIRETVAQAARAGVRTIMITGDHRNTAIAIGRELGLPVGEGFVLTGEELEAMSEAEFERVASQVSIYARTTPRHKARIIDALQKRGEVVAMTGDGVNDAPALKSADIGIAVGSGTDVAKETADVVLLDNNFKTIIRAIEGGRVIFENIRKVVVYLLSDNFKELAILALSLALGLPLPLLPAQILWINLAVDALPAAALAFDHGEQGLLREPPRPRGGAILLGPHRKLMFSIGSITTILFLALFIFLIQMGEGIEYARTIIFVGLSMSSLLYLYSCRSLRFAVWQKNPFSNWFVNAAILFGGALLVAAVYVPSLQWLLDTVPLEASDWIFIAAVSVMNVFLVELLKRFFVMRLRTS
ncbi:MAG: HAD-IC family P-type ATPase [Patescibacteria group bacterium]